MSTFLLPAPIKPMDFFLNIDVTPDNFLDTNKIGLFQKVVNHIFETLVLKNKTGASDRLSVSIYCSNATEIWELMDIDEDYLQFIKNDILMLLSGNTETRTRGLNRFNIDYKAARGNFLDMSIKKSIESLKKKYSAHNVGINDRKVVIIYLSSINESNWAQSYCSSLLNNLSNNIKKLEIDCSAHFFDINNIHSSKLANEFNHLGNSGKYYLLEHNNESEIVYKFFENIGRNNLFDIHSKSQTICKNTLDSVTVYEKTFSINSNLNKEIPIDIHLRFNNSEDSNSLIDYFPKEFLLAKNNITPVKINFLVIHGDKNPGNIKFSISPKDVLLKKYFNTSDQTISVSKFIKNENEGITINAVNSPIIFKIWKSKTSFELDIRTNKSLLEKASNKLKLNWKYNSGSSSNSNQISDNIEISKESQKFIIPIDSNSFNPGFTNGDIEFSNKDFQDILFIADKNGAKNGSTFSLKFYKPGLLYNIFFYLWILSIAFILYIFIYRFTRVGHIDCENNPKNSFWTSFWKNTFKPLRALSKIAFHKYEYNHSLVKNESVKFLINSKIFNSTKETPPEVLMEIFNRGTDLTYKYSPSNSTPNYTSHKKSAIPRKMGNDETKFDNGVENKVGNMLICFKKTDKNTKNISISFPSVNINQHASKKVPLPLNKAIPEENLLINRSILVAAILFSLFSFILLFMPGDISIDHKFLISTFSIFILISVNIVNLHNFKSLKGNEYMSHYIHPYFSGGAIVLDIIRKCIL